MHLRMCEAMGRLFMQTFLISPDPTFRDTMQCLDTKRLGKQRVEAMQILQALQRTSGGWINHPAVRMWRGYDAMLRAYHDACIDAWIARGYVNTMQHLAIGQTWHATPSWWHDERVYASHRSNLLRKDAAHYGQFGWREPNNLPYHWPV